MTTWQRKYLYFFVFITGAAVMAIEIAASRLLAPFFGNSMYVWAIIITIIMIGLALGYWWGGKFADKFPTKQGLFKVALTAGVLTSIIPLVSQFLFKLVEKGIFNTPLNTVVVAFFGSCILFLPAVILYGFISPYTTRIVIDKISHTGHVAGNIYAFSTFGSIIGVLVTTFLLIPFIGTRETILIFSSLVILVSAAGLVKWPYYLLLLLPIILFFFYHDGIKKNSDVVFEKDTLYQFVQVVDNNSTKYLKFDEGAGYQSIFDFTKNISGNYYDYFVYLPDLIGKTQQNVAILGFGGGVAAKELKLYKNDYDLTIDGVEIDPAVKNIARNYFAVSDSDANIFVDDGRRYLSNIDKNYDTIIIDTYSRELYIPFHLATREFFNLAMHKLNDGGVIAMNVNAISSNSPILTSIAKTLANVFSDVYINHLDGTSNYLVFASNNKINFSRAKSVESYPKELQSTRDKLVSNTKKLNIIDPKALILTDNRAPLEYLTEHLFFEYAN